MKVDRKTKAEKTPPVTKTVKSARRVAPKTNGKHPLIAYEHIPIGIVETSLDGKYVDVNEEFCRILGCSREELLQLGIRDCTDEDDYSIDSKLYEQLIAGKIPFYRLEKRFVRKQGGIIWVELTRTPVHNSKGKPLYTVGVVLDISDRKDVERGLRESVERLRLASGAAKMFMWEWDFQTQSYIIADSFEQVLGFSGSLLPKNKFETLWALSPREDIERISEAFERAVEHQSDLHALPTRVINPENDQIVWLEISAKIVYDREGNPERMFGVAQNITESKNAQDEIAIISRMPEENPNPVMRLTPEGSVLYANASSRMMLEVWKLQGDQTIPEELQKGIEEAFASGAKKEIEIAQNGKIFSCTLAPILEAGYINFYASDITGRKQADEALRESEQRYRFIVENTSDGIWWIELTKPMPLSLPEDEQIEWYYNYAVIRQCNLGLARMYGYRSVEEVIGLPVRIVMPRENPLNLELSRRFIQSGYRLVDSESREVSADGRELVFLNNMIGIIEDGKLTGEWGTNRDITERKHAEEALRQSEDRFARFMQHLPGLAWIKDMDGCYVYANAAAEKAFNTPQEKLYGQTDEDIFSPNVAAQFRENDTQALMNEKGVQVIETLEHADGVLHSSLVNKFPIPGPDGSTILIGGTAFDITERKQAEEALRDSEERFRAILRQATAGIVRKDAEGRLLFVNEAFCNMLGYTESDLIGKTVWEFMHPDDVTENQRSYKRLMVEGIPFKLERRFLREDGSVIWVDASVSPILDATGKPQSAVAVEVDITGRKQAEEALLQLNLQLEDRVLSRTAKLRAVNQTLREEIAERKKAEEALRKSEAAARENEEKLSTLFELLPVGISFLDLEGQIIQMNTALANILKLSKQPLSDQAYKSRTYIRANGTLMPPMEFASQRALVEGKTIYNVETGVIMEDSEVIWTSVSAAPVAVADVGAVVVTTDITESKRAERALRESRERLQILSQRLVEVQEDERRAIARELHDRVGQTLAALNVNLIIISGQLGDKIDEQISTRLNDSMKLVAETISLVRDVMSNLRPSVLDDYGLEAAIESHLSQFMSRYEIHVKFEKPDQLIPRLGPSTEMTFLRIAQESLMNIARHAQATQVNLSLRPEEEVICMTIQDNGTGIKSWQDANRPGSHGLTIMRERAEAFGGNLRVDSVLGQGTRVEVRIPVENSNPPPAGKETRP